MTLGGNPSASGDFFIGSNLSVSGGATFGDNVIISGTLFAEGISVLETASISNLSAGTLFVTSSATIGDNLFVSKSAYIGENLYVNGVIYGNISASVSGTATNALTASHLEEQGVAIFAALGSTPGYISGGIFYSSSGDWFLS
jgi:predicted acyltransferase (DUF342 family)